MNPSRFTLPMVLGALAGTALAQRHPLYDDKGTLAWHTKLAEAKAAAAKADKLILVEVGTKT